MLLEVRMEHLLNAGVHAKHILLSTYSAQSTRLLWESVWGKYCPTLHTKFRTTPNGNRMKLASHARLLPSSACCEGQACKQASQDLQHPEMESEYQKRKGIQALRAIYSNQEKNHIHHSQDLL